MSTQDNENAIATGNLRLSLLKNSKYARLG